MREEQMLLLPDSGGAVSGVVRKNRRVVTASKTPTGWEQLRAAAKALRELAELSEHPVELLLFECEGLIAAAGKHSPVVEALFLLRMEFNADALCIRLVGAKRNPPVTSSTNIVPLDPRRTIVAVHGNKRGLVKEWEWEKLRRLIDERFHVLLFPRLKRTLKQAWQMRSRSRRCEITTLPLAHAKKSAARALVLQTVADTAQRMSDSLKPLPGLSD